MGLVGGFFFDYQAGLEVCIGQDCQGFGSGVAVGLSLWREAMNHPVLDAATCSQLHLQC